MSDEEIGRLLIKLGTNAMTFFRFTTLWTLQGIKVAVSVAVLTGLLTACATMTTFSPDIADQSGLSGQMTPDEAVAIIRTKASASGVDADHGSFMIDGKGLSFAKTDTVKKKIKFKGEIVEIEFDETRIQQVAWQSISKLEPYLKNTIVGDLYGVSLELLASNYISAPRYGGSTELNLHCGNYNDLTAVVAALQTLIGKEGGEKLE